MNLLLFADGATVLNTESDLNKLMASIEIDMSSPNSGLMIIIFFFLTGIKPMDLW